MRHVLGFVLAIVMALAVFFGGSWGYLRLLRVPVVNGATSTLPAAGGSLLHDKNVLLAFAALAGVALLAGILIAVPRISPLAAGLPGLLFVAWTVVYGLSVKQAVQYIPLKHDVFGDGFEALLFNGLLAVAGVVLLIPLFVSSRWRGRPGYYEDGADGQQSVAPALLADQWAETSPYPQQQPPFGA
ncbi:MAG: hypothetical protein ACRDN0_22480 [Trebonia sp.]